MRKIRKKYKRPQRPWDLKRLEDEKVLMKEYGLRKKRELWKSQEILRQFRSRARELIAKKDEAKEKALIQRLARLGMLGKESTLDNVLALEIRSVLDRRLQSLVQKRGISKTPLHARQLVSHGRILVAGKRAKFPSYLVPRDLEGQITLEAGK